MKILITGGSGFLARNLKPLFEQAGYEVLAPSHSELNILNFESLDRFAQRNKVNAIIHTASKGGKRIKADTFEEVLVPNIKMFEHLIDVQWWNPVPIIILGSGAEFDRRDRIIECPEEMVFTSWPIDPYGLSKNIIARRSLTEVNNVFVLRMFGCFNYDEDATRFIKSGILNLKRGLPIEIHQNRKMDFFYLDDVFTVIDYILRVPMYCPKNINLVYPDKVSLLDVASLIHKHTGIFDHRIKINESGDAYDYTGDGTVLSRLPFHLVGLEEGIHRTVLKLV